MAKVFDGKKFLDSKMVTVNFSNGVIGQVTEISDAQMAVLDSLGNTENTGVEFIRDAVAKLVNVKGEDIKQIGIVELRGVMDFLSESLFG